MFSKSNFLLVSVILLTPVFTSNVTAAGRCSVVRTESTFELINAPAEEMLNSRNSSAISCLFLKDFISRANAPFVNNNPSGTVTNPAGGAYVPKTKFDNSPWRFDMNQNGKRMTSVEFDAWMKAKGIRVATGKPITEAPPPAPAIPECVQNDNLKC